ncbi:hypothetical protein E2C01_048569 [Portunus trituberculatus]|uniref:Ig-like domain-containing protein n=1 Tax=Portunus trituberculatus TaxID=210409 RepID=A0A5B7GAW9_PORTR|nr:hypothetical protein [Portunus trituberculatus]
MHYAKTGRAVLTVDNLVMTRNNRISLLQEREGASWSLVISNVTTTDQGSYVCEVNTPSPTRLSFNIVVKGIDAFQTLCSCWKCCSELAVHKVSLPDRLPRLGSCGVRHLDAQTRADGDTADSRPADYCWPASSLPCPASLQGSDHGVYCFQDIYLCPLVNFIGS